MPRVELQPRYNPSETEETWLRRWEAVDAFHAEPQPGKPAYSIVIPPPNVTEILHVGHALNNTLQDVIIRWRRMSGDVTEWLPGVDHAGIATQTVVVKQLTSEGKTPEQIGREEFVNRAWAWKEDKANQIIEQLKAMGCSCDWRRERFTMDEGYTRATTEVFVRLYEKGLIYRGRYIVNWCPKHRTTLSDDEVEREPEAGSLWYIRYKVKGSSRWLTVATTRPETMLGDTGVAVHPDDERFSALVGQKAILPLVDRELDIVADAAVDPEFGTGAVKVTPGHDPNDFDLGKRHGLPVVEVIDERGVMTEDAGSRYAGLDRFACRKRLLTDLYEGGYLVKTEDYELIPGRCYRCGTIIEPRLSLQWFLKMKPLASPAISAVKDGKLRFHPAHWEKTYLYWLDNVRDWCISRQLWWGHRIPAYICNTCGDLAVSRTRPDECPKCGGADLTQDPDVLDTWFTSWLWPFVSFGWPEESVDRDCFYPTASLFTANEIIYLWVARMVMAGYEFIGELPFSDVAIHGTVRDTRGVKMSKSLGNGIDPRDIIRDYGSDALRATLVLVAPDGQDPLLGPKTFELGRNLANKIWNAARFVLMNLPADRGLPEAPERVEVPPNRWIRSRLTRAVAEIDSRLSRFQINAAAKAATDFFRSDFCDWYLEFAKRSLIEQEDEAHVETLGVLTETLISALGFLHPFVPFVTEQIYARLHEHCGAKPEADVLAVAAWPDPPVEWVDERIEADVDLIQRVIGAVRTMRGDLNVPPSRLATAAIRCADPDVVARLQGGRRSVCELARLSDFTVASEEKKPPFSATSVLPEMEIHLPLEGLIDPEAERSRLTKEHERLTTLLEKTNLKLQNDDFLRRAPEPVVDAERERREDLVARIAKLEGSLESILGW